MLRSHPQACRLGDKPVPGRDMKPSELSDRSDVRGLGPRAVSMVAAWQIQVVSWFEDLFGVSAPQV